MSRLSSATLRSIAIVLQIVGASAAIGLVAVPLLSSGAGCATQETTPAPDAAPPPCNPGPHIFCAPTTADQPSCDTDEGTYPLLTRLPRATHYPLGCVVNLVGERDPEGGDCLLDTVCKCLVPTPAPSPIVDAGNAADAGDAAAPPPPPPAGDGGPRWNCAP